MPRSAYVQVETLLRLILAVVLVGALIWLARLAVSKDSVPGAIIWATVVIGFIIQK